MKKESLLSKKDLNMLKEWDNVRLLVLQDLKAYNIDVPLQCEDAGLEENADMWLFAHEKGAEIVKTPDLNKWIDVHREEYEARPPRWKVSYRRTEWSQPEAEIFDEYPDAVDCFNEHFYNCIWCSFEKMEVRNV